MKTFYAEGKIREVTHYLNRDTRKGNSDAFAPKGTPVHLLGSRKEADGHWSVIVICPIKDRKANCNGFVTRWENLTKAIDWKEPS